MARAGLAALLATMASAGHAQDARSLVARHAALRDTLAHSAFGRPLSLESSETPGNLKGDVYARVAQPFAIVGPALQDIGHWCDLLMLHLNVKGCLASAPGEIASLSLRVGRKSDQPIEEAYRLDFRYRVTRRSGPEYLKVELGAEDGPVGTKRYRMALEAVGLDTGHSFLHLSYTYDFGFAARMAMSAYLATSGNQKRGFSIVGHGIDGLPIYIGGTRGVIERNTMRYFIAIEAYLDALSAPESQRQEKRLEDWYAGVERYPRQLHELEHDQYLAMKRTEIERMVRLSGDEAHR